MHRWSRLALVAAVLLAGCATVRRLGAPDTERLLMEAGFTRQPADPAMLATLRPAPVPVAPIDVWGIRIRTYDLLVLAIAAVATLSLMAFLQRTKRGAAMQAVAMDHEAATAVGIHVGRSNSMAFVIGAGLAALAGGLVGPMLYVSPSMGGSLGIKGFAAAILGGFGSIPGAIVGGLAIGVLDSYAAGHFQGYSELVLFVVFTVIIMIRPTGIFGETTVNRA